MRFLSVLVLAVVVTVPGFAKKSKNPMAAAAHPASPAIKHTAPNRGIKHQGPKATKHSGPKAVKHASPKVSKHPKQ